MRRRVKLDDGAAVTAIAYPARGPHVGTLVLAHGAGADQEHAFMVDIARRLARTGVRAITFNFPYTETGRRAPDPPAVLQRCFRAVVADERRRTKVPTASLFIGGKSLGGRMASHLVADGDPGMAGLVCLGYPLHPPGKPDKLRTSHLGRIRVPVLIVQGTRDPFGGPEDIRAHTRVVEGPVTIFPVQEGDHSFKVPKRVAAGDVVMSAIVDRIVRWMRAITQVQPPAT